MAVSLIFPPELRIDDANGTPVTVAGVAGTTGIEIFEAGTSTQKNSYPTQADAVAGTNANSNPLAIADGFPENQVWVDGLVKTVVKYGSVTRTVDNRGDASDVNVFDKNHIAGLTVSRTSATVIAIAAGECRDDADTFDITLSATVSPDITASGANGLDTGSEANSTLYYVWLIADSSGTNSVAGLLSASATSPTLPSGYDKKRLIWAVYNDSSGNFLDFTQAGDYCRYTGDVIDEVDDNTISADTAEVATLSAVPASCIAHIYGNLRNTTETATEAHLHIRTNGAADDVTSTTEAWAAIATAAVFDEMTSIGSVLVDSSSQVQYAASEAAGTASVRIRTLGFWMVTRRDP